MAFEKDDSTDSGFTAAAAYHRVAYVRGDPKAAQGLGVFVASYRSKADRDAGVAAFKRREFTGIVVDWAAGGFGAQIYTQVKASAQNEGFFSDASDVI